MAAIERLYLKVGTKAQYTAQRTNWDATNTFAFTPLVSEFTSNTTAGLGQFTVGGTTITTLAGTVGTATRPVYLNGGTLTQTTYTLEANVKGGAANKLAYYSSATQIDDYTSTVGDNTTNALTPIYLNAGVPTALSNDSGSATKGVWVDGGDIKPMTYSLNANLNAGTANKLAYYSGANAVDDYTATVGANTAGAEVPIYMNAGVPTAMTTTSGGTAQPVYLNAGKISPISATVGSNTASTATAGAGSMKPVYLNAGTITAATANIGLNTAAAGTTPAKVQPIYMTAGTLQPVTQTVGGAAKPVYLKDGVITPCDDMGGVKDVLKTDSTYYPVYMAKDNTPSGTDDYVTELEMANTAVWSFSPGTKKWNYTTTDSTAITFGLTKVASW